MIPKYYIYDASHAPEALLAKHPKPAVYGTALLFVEGLEIVTGVAPSLVYDLASLGFNHPFIEGGAGLTAEQLIATATQLFAPEPPATGSEVQATKGQADYIYEVMFKPEGLGSE